MRNTGKSKNQLLEEIAQLRQHLTRMELSLAKYKQIEEELRLKEGILDNASDLMYLRNLDGTFIYVNETISKMLGYTREEFIKMNIHQIVAPGYPWIKEQILEDLTKKDEITIETALLHKDGSILPIESHARFIKSDGEKFILAIIRDIAERKRAEEELRLRAELLDNAADFILLRDFDGNCVYANETVLRALGYTREEFMNLKIEQVIALGASWTKGSLGREIERKGEITLDSAYRRKDGSIIPVETHGRFVQYGDRKLILSSVRDVTERKKAEEELRLKEQILDSANDAIILRDPEGKIVYANEMAYKSHGYTKEEFLGINIYELIAPEQEKFIPVRTRDIRKKGTITFESLHVHKNGSLMPLEVNASIIEIGSKKFIITVNRDISERKIMQDRLIIADRLAALGEMSLGFAHELNNPLTGVIGYAQLLLEDKSLPEKTRADMELIHSQAQRVATIIKNFLYFARAQPSIRQPIELNMVIDTVLKLREYEHKLHNITVVCKLSTDLPAVMADISQLQQVFLNIIINAEHFMFKAHNKGTITITTEKAENMVRISIADDGPGIPPENLPKIFNPFFTTREVGQGTGLGLSICHGIINEHGGRIYAESKPGKGTTFIIELPVAGN